MEVKKGDLVKVGSRYALVERVWDCSRVRVMYLDTETWDTIGIGNVCSVVCHTDW
jgi:hypothetical protein